MTKFSSIKLKYWEYRKLIYAKIQFGNMLKIIHGLTIRELSFKLPTYRTSTVNELMAILSNNMFGNVALAASGP